MDSAATGPGALATTAPVTATPHPLAAPPPSPRPTQNGRPAEQTPQPPARDQEPPTLPPTLPTSTPIVTPPPGIKTEDRAAAPQREQREKKDSWKKKEAKESGSKGTPPQASTTPAPVLPPSLPFRLRPPPYRQEDINAPPRLPTFTPAYQTTLKRPAPDDSATADQGAALDFFRVGDQPFNRKKFRYTPCAAAPDLPQLMYRGIHLPPHRARIDWQDMNPYILIDPEGMTCTTEKGYRMVRTNVCVRSGDWFVEFKVIRGGGDQGGHVRVGFARRETPLDVPVGFDGYSYGLRDVSGQKVHLARPKAFMPPFGTGDVIGLHISLPPSTSSEPDADSIPPQTPVFRDRIPIRFRGQLYFEQPDYTASKEMDDLLTPVLPPATQLNPSIPASKPTLPILEGSFIDVYKNGEFQGRAFEDLLAFLPPSSQLGGKDLDDGALGYYPAMSVFRYGIVRVNFGPDFEAFPPELEGRGVRGMWERYEEMLREEKEWDLLDEMEWEKEARERQASAGGVETVPVAGAEIKELADDEWT